MTDSGSERMLALVEQMPAFSRTLTKIIALANDPSAAPKDLVGAISMDPTLMAKLLKLINSAYFGLRQPIVSLNRAVIMLGFNTVKNVALSIGVAGALKIKGDSQWFNRDAFWEHSLGCAVAVKALGARTGVGALDIEEYFVAGLLHDIGKVLFIQSFASECEKIYNPDFEPGRTRLALEKEVLGVSHDELGGIIARHWKFPESLAEAISGHHDPFAENQGANPALRLTVYLANIFLNQRKISIHPQEKPVIIPDGVWASFPLSFEETGDALADIESTIEKAKIFLTIMGD